MRSVIRTQPDRADRRDAICERLSAAVERLVASGIPYADVSVERLCREAEISRGTFYVYFEDKGDLLAQMAAANLRSFADSKAFWWHLPPGSGKHDLRVMFRKTADLYREHSGVMRALSQTAAYDQAMAEQLRAIVDWAIKETCEHVEDGLRRGTVRADVDPGPTAEWLCWMFERGLYEIAGLEDDDRLEPMVEAVTDLLWNILYRDA